MAGGALARPAGASTLRTQTEWFQRPEPPAEIKKSEEEIITRIESLSKKKGVSMAQVALAWMLHKDGAFQPLPSLVFLFFALYASRLLFVSVGWC
jgi:aryl-alcohol dehydrogenase-like predicted oxidoreductase